MLIKIFSLNGDAIPREGANLKEGAKPNKYGVVESYLDIYLF